MKNPRPRLIEELVTLQVTRVRRYAVADSSPPAAPKAEIVTSAEELPSRPGLASTCRSAPLAQVVPLHRKAG